MIGFGNEPPGQRERDIQSIKLAAVDLAILRMRLDSNEPLSDILLDERLR